MLSDIVVGIWRQYPWVGLSEGLDGGDEGPGSGLCLLRHHSLPRFRALPGGGETPTSCLLRIDWTISITVLLELFGLEEEEEDRIPQTKGPGPLI
jgi:hypothetical protein